MEILSRNLDQQADGHLSDRPRPYRSLAVGEGIFFAMLRAVDRSICEVS